MCHMHIYETHNNSHIHILPNLSIVLKCCPVVSVDCENSFSKYNLP